MQNHCWTGTGSSSPGIHDITLAAGSDQALQAQARYPTGASFELVLANLHMPGKDGFQKMAALAGAGYRGALIIVSGQDSKVLRSASPVAPLRRLGCSDRCTSP